MRAILTPCLILLKHLPNELVQDILSVKQTRAYTIIREMVNEGLIVKHGLGKEDNTYILTEPK